MSRYESKPTNSAAKAALALTIVNLFILALVGYIACNPAEFAGASGQTGAVRDTQTYESRIAELEDEVDALSSQLDEYLSAAATTTTTVEDAAVTESTSTTASATTTTTKNNGGNNGGGGGGGTAKPTTKSTTTTTTKASNDNDNLGEWTDGWN